MRIRIILSAVVAVLILLSLSMVRGMSAQVAYPHCFEDEAIVKVVAEWTGDGFSFVDGPYACVPIGPLIGWNDFAKWPNR